MLAITGYSGTGKTTLLEKLLPKLTACNLRVGLIKHSHHNIDVDKPGKDSHRLRLAGANPTAIACDERWALMTETPEQAVNFQQIITNFKDVDLVLVEGFKHEALPKFSFIEKGLKSHCQSSINGRLPLPPITRLNEKIDWISMMWMKWQSL